MAGTNNRRSETADPNDLPERMVEAMNNQSGAMDNLAASIDDLREFAEAAAKKIKVGKMLGSLFGGNRD